MKDLLGMILAMGWGTGMERQNSMTRSSGLASVANGME
jgi:hypothetical protein